MVKFDLKNLLINIFAANREYNSCHFTFSSTFSYDMVKADRKTMQ